MTLQEYINKLQNFVEENPSSKDATIIEFSVHYKRDIIVKDVEISQLNRKLEQSSCVSGETYSEGNYIMFDNVY